MTGVQQHRPARIVQAPPAGPPAAPRRTWIGWRHSLVLAMDNPTLPTCASCGCLLADAEHSPRCQA